MRGKQTLIINGKVYDAVTGLPMAAPYPVAASHATATLPPKQQPAARVDVAPNTPRTPHHAKHAHRATKKSATLRREFLARPAAQTTPVSNTRQRAAGHVERSEMIRRFAPHPQPLKKASVKPVQPRLDITPVKSKPASIVAQKQALVAKPAALTASATTQPLNTRSVREQLIAERLAAVDPTKPKKAPKKRGGLFSKQPRMASLVAASFAIIMLGGYFTYLNMPGLSVRVAAAQAGVAASFPDYRPDGYRFSGPVAFAPGQVAINFLANGGNSKYTVTEQKSTWDSQAVYDNIVAKVADDSYVTNSQQGLTIYTFKGEAAWVNKGILYTISGDAPLSNEQLLRIAGSL